MYILSMKILPTDEQVFGWFARKIPTPPDWAIKAIYIFVFVVVGVGGIGLMIYDLAVGKPILSPSVGSTVGSMFFRSFLKHLF